MTATKKEIEKAMTEAFDAHERHRDAMAAARRAHGKAREADDQVRHLRQLASRRAASKRAGSR